MQLLSAQVNRKMTSNYGTVLELGDVHLIKLDLDLVTWLVFDLLMPEIAALCV